MDFFICKEALKISLIFEQPLWNIESKTLIKKKHYNDVFTNKKIFFNFNIFICTKFILIKTVFNWIRKKKPKLIINLTYSFFLYLNIFYINDY